MNCKLIFLFFLLTNCSASKKVITQTQKLNNLNYLSDFIVKQENKTYDLLHSKIDLPLNYDTITWVDELGERYMGHQLDSINNKYLYYGRLLDSLLFTSLKEPIKVEEIIKYFGEPTLIETNKKVIIELDYFFNTKRNPNCSETEKFNYVNYNKCSLLVFEFDVTGNLKKIHKGMFWP